MQFLINGCDLNSDNKSVMCTIKKFVQRFDDNFNQVTFQEQIKNVEHVKLNYVFVENTPPFGVVTVACSDIPLSHSGFLNGNNIHIIGSQRLGDHHVVESKVKVEGHSINLRTLRFEFYNEQQGRIDTSVYPITMGLEFEIDQNKM